MRIEVRNRTAQDCGARFAVPLQGGAMVRIAHLATSEMRIEGCLLDMAP
jgi:hypothetical protein